MMMGLNGETRGGSETERSDPKAVGRERKRLAWVKRKEAGKERWIFSGRVGSTFCVVPKDPGRTGVWREGRPAKRVPPRAAECRRSVQKFVSVA
jgi:hypothetical protein